MIRRQTVVGAWGLVMTTVFAGCTKPPAPTTAPSPAEASPAEASSSNTAPAAQPVATNDTIPAEESAAAPDASSGRTPAEAQKPAAAFYSVATYDENQDPAADLAATIQRATAENKRILIQVGGEWCIWCHRISDYMETNEKVRQLVDDHFIVMKVTYPGAHAESFLKSYPRVEAYPHLFVLEPDGQVLHSQGTSELEFEKSYNEEVFCRFLNDWVL